MNLLKHSTASQVIPLGFYLDSTDGNTEETGLTIANTDLWIWKEGAISLVNKNSGGATHMQNGVFYTTLDATDSNTKGKIKIFTHVAGALVVVWEGLVVPVATYDALVTNGLNDIAATSIVSAGAITTSAGAVSNVTTVATCTTNTDMRGTDSAATAANLAIVDTNVDAILVDTNELQLNQGNWLTATGFATTAEIADVPTVAEFNARTLPSADYFVVTDYTAPPSAATISTQVWAETTRVLTAGTNIALAKGIGVTGFNDITVSDILTTQMTESYAADGVAPTLAQSLFLTMQNLQDFSFSGTTQTVKRIDGATTAATYTLDDATSPTSKTRAT